MKRGLRSGSLRTVCEEARCPNMGECFMRGTATFLILGKVCTRRCGFCAIASGTLNAPDPDEPGRVARQIHELLLSHAVITSVTRDDLPDGGAGHFARTIRAVRRQNPQSTIEVLCPDFQGKVEDIETVLAAKPQVFNHNLETVERMTPSVRSPQASYRRSLGVLAFARRCHSTGLIKSGLMVGLGETDEEVLATLADLRDAGCDIVTIGQYLRPTRGALAVKRYVEPDRFDDYRAAGMKMGFSALFCGPFVRSSFCAEEMLHSTANLSSERRGYL